MKTKRRKRMTPWPPAELMLPDSIAEIERGRIAQKELFPPDDSREGRLQRLLADIPGVKRASRLRPPKPIMRYCG